jgi:hypothetical protein
MGRFVPEIDFSGIEPEEDRMIETRLYRDVAFDDRRCWTLGSIWFLGGPVLIFQEAGREGRDHRRRYVVDRELYWKMVAYLQTLPRTDDWVFSDGELVGLDEEMGDDLTHFYGCDLETVKGRHSWA